MSQATYSEIAYQDSRGGLRFSHVIDGGSFWVILYNYEDL
jgi:hypothetical protein